MQRVSIVVWGLVIGIVVLFVFFTAIAGVDPRDVAIVTGVIALLALAFTVRSMRVGFELRAREGDPQLRAEHNRVRERRGF